MQSNLLPQGAQYIELKKDLTSKIDLIHKDGKEIALNGLEGVIEEYKEVRGRGEKKQIINFFDMDLLNNNQGLNIKNTEIEQVQKQKHEYYL